MHRDDPHRACVNCRGYKCNSKNTCIECRKWDKDVNGGIREFLHCASQSTARDDATTRDEDWYHVVDVMDPHWRSG